MKQTFAHCIRENPDVHYAIVDLSKAYDRINISSPCNKLKATYLPRPIVYLIEFISHNTFVCTSNVGCLSDERKVGNGVRQGGVTSGIIFNFYLTVNLTDFADLPLGCELSGNRVNIFCHADDNALLAHTENALQFMLDTLASELENLCLKINVEKSCDIVFKLKSRKISTNLSLQGQPLKQVSECVYLGVVLMDNLACTSDMERSKRTFFQATLFNLPKIQLR